MQERKLGLNGFNARYIESTRSVTADKHVLFIHGLGSSADRWLGIMKVLSRYYHTIAVDLLGFGGSDKPATIDYTMNDFRDFIIDFIDELGISDCKTSIVGHSLGGYVAAEVTIEKKYLVERLVLIDSSGMLRKPTPLLERYLDAAIDPSYEKVRKVFEQMVADPARVNTKLVNDFIRRMNLTNAKYPFKLALANSANTQIGLKRLKLIDDIRTLIIWGREDKVIPLHYSKLFKQAIKKSELKIIEDAGHAPFVEKPGLVSEIIHTFLSSNP